MKGTALAVLIGGLCLAGCDDDDPTGPDVETLTATLTGAAEVPGPGDADGTGTATITIDDDANEVCWDITVANITLPATAAHIHPGAAGVSGNPVVTLGAPAADGSSDGCVAASDALLDDILETPGEYYVNVHTVDFAGGAIRGQLSS